MPLPFVFCTVPCRGRGDMIKRRVCVSGIVLVLAVGGAAVSRAESRAVQSSPSDGGELRLRVAAYWRLLAEGDRKDASWFLRPEDRPYFLEHPEPPFQDPEVKGIEPSGDGTRAVARIAFDLFTPIGPFRWEIRQAWTCVAGEWMAEPRRSAGNPFRGNFSPAETPPPADEGCRH